MRQRRHSKWKMADIGKVLATRTRTNKGFCVEVRNLDIQPEHLHSLVLGTSVNKNDRLPGYSPTAFHSCFYMLDKCKLTYELYYFINEWYTTVKRVS